jgi:CheY-like chemotaxis protein
MLRRVLGSTFDVRADVRSGVHAHFDLTMFQQCIVNLALNARDAMPNGGPLSIEVGEALLSEAPASAPGVAPGPYVVVTVRDTGTGMAPEVLDRVLEPFFTTKPPDRGTGLGLSIVHGFVQQSGGFIEIDSQVGSGTEVRVYLPRVSSPQPSVRPVEPRIHTRRRESILVVDDERLLLNAMRRSLEREGFRIFQASEADGALAVLGEHLGEIDVVVSDVTLPGMSGTELVREVAQRSPRTKLVLMSGYADEEITRAPGTRFIQKPFEARALAALIHELLGHSPR